MKRTLLLLLLSLNLLSAMTILAEKGNDVLNFQAGRAQSYFSVRSFEFEGSYASDIGLQIGLGYQYSHEEMWTSEYVEESWYSRYFGNIAFVLLDHNKRKFPLDIWITTQFYYDNHHTDSFSNKENGLIYGLALKRNFRIFDHVEIIPQFSAEHLIFKRIGIGVEDGFGKAFMLISEISIRYRFLYAYANYVHSIQIAGISNYYFNNSQLHWGVGFVIN